MCVQNHEDEYYGREDDGYRCGMCEECCEEERDKEYEQKKKDTSCGNCGWCEECDY